MSDCSAVLEAVGVVVRVAVPSDSTGAAGVNLGVGVDRAVGVAIDVGVRVDVAVAGGAV